MKDRDECRRRRLTEPFPLTRPQLEVANIIAELTDVLRRPPTCGEVAREMDVRKSVVSRYANSLQDRGWLAPVGPGKKRTLELIERPAPLPDCAVEITVEGLLAMATESAEARP